MSTLTRLLNFLPSCFNIDPQQIAVFSVTYDDPNTMMEYTVRDNVLSARAFSSMANDFEIELEGKTIQQVADEIKIHHHYTTTVYSSGGKSALRLVEVEGSRESMVYAFTSPTWAVFKAMAMELKTAHSMMQEALRHMSVQGSTGYITDYWCEFLNNKRKLNETDIVFGLRAIEEIKLPKSNNVAMEVILQQHYGFEIKVIDLIFTQTARMAMNDITTPMHSRLFPIADASSIEKEPGVFGLIFPDNTISTWDSVKVNELRTLVHKIKAEGTRGKCFWRDLADTPWMLMNNVPTPVHDTGFILPYTKKTEFFTLYL